MRRFTLVHLIRKLRERLFYKVILVFLVLSLAPMAFIGLIETYTAKKYLEEETSKTQLSIAQRVADSSIAYVQNGVNLLSLIRSSGDFLQMQPDRQRQVIQDFMDAYPFFVKVQFFDDQDRLQVSVSRFKKVQEEFPLSKLNKIRAETEAQGVYLGEFEFSSVGYPSMMIAVPIRSRQEQFNGILISEINLLGICQTMHGLPLGEEGEAFIISKDSQLVSHSDINQMVKRPLPESMTSLLQSASLAKSDSGSSIAVRDSETYLFSYVQIPQYQWFVFVKQPTAQAYVLSQKLRQEAFLFISVTSVITLLLGFLLGGKLTRPLQGLTAAAQEIGEGHFDVAIQPTTKDEIGQLTRKFIWMKDSLKKLTEELKTKNHQLERTNEMKTRFLATVNHDLRSPLAAIKGFLEVSHMDGEERNWTKEEKECVEIPMREVKRMVHMVNDLLDFSGIESGKLSIDRQPCDVAELLRDAVKAQQMIVEAKGLRFSDNLPSTPCLAQVDQNRIIQVLSNLVYNAAKFTREGGEIQVSLLQSGGDLIISVKDTGPGISKENLARIFEPFYQVEQRGNKAGGLGLGLPISKEIIEQHGGRIWADSPGAGLGATFSFTLPMHIGPVATKET